MPRRAVRRPRRRAAKKRTPRPKGGRQPIQMAKVTETIEFNNISPNYVQGLTFCLNQFERARTIATNFRWMKPTKVSWLIEPQFNVYQSTAGGSTVPYVYTIMNRSQDATTLTLSDLLTQGAKPVKLTNLKRMSYRPNWCSPGLMVQNVVAGSGFGGLLNNVVMTGLKPEYDWVQCPNFQYSPQNTVTPAQFASTAFGRATNDTVVNNPGIMIYNGHQVYIKQQFSSATTPTFKITCTVNWSFKDPKNVLATAVDNIFTDISGAEV